MGDNYISADKLPQIRQITDDLIETVPWKMHPPGNIATIAPQLLVQSEVKGTSVIFAGIEPEEEITIKSWWQVSRGEFISKDNQAVVGSIAADLLKINIGDTIAVNQSQVTVSGILDETGSGDDYRIFVPLTLLQQAFNKPGLISTIDIRALCNGCPVETHRRCYQ